MDQEDRDHGQSMREGTFNHANSAIGRWLGDNRSDQQIEDDAAVTEGLKTGQRTVRGSNGRSIDVASYSRDIAPSSGMLARLNSAPSIGLFSSAASLAPFPANIPARIVGGMIDDRLGTRATLGSSGIRFGN
ncbi:MAG: hypothetical protein VW443_07300 [Pseudomonadales bacterium]